MIIEQISAAIIGQPQFRSSLFQRAGLLLIGSDVVLILINIVIALLRMLGQVEGNIDAWLVFHETSIASNLTYLKWAAIVFFLGISATRSRVLVLGALSALFGYILLDDTLQLHEQAGAYFADTLGLHTVMAVPAEDVGQLLFLGTVGLVSAAFLAAGYLAATPKWRQVAIVFFAGILGLAFFGVLVDCVHSMTNSLAPGLKQKILDVTLAIFEDGGEMIVASLLCALAVAVWYDTRETEAG